MLCQSRNALAQRLRILTGLCFHHDEGEKMPLRWSELNGTRIGGVKHRLRLKRPRDFADANHHRPAVVVGICKITRTDRKSTRLNSSHQIISYAVFCLKKKKIKNITLRQKNK